jgi:formylglycine-generating enzyme required for sulfatase activity
VAGPITNRSVLVSNGLFTTVIDFGADVFQGGAAWLELAVRPAGAEGPFTVLLPRQSLTPVPYAIQTLKAERLTGPLPLSQLPTNVARLDANQTFAGTVTFSGNVQFNGALSGNGAGLSNVTATGLSARLAQRLWRMTLPFVAVTNAGNPADFTGKGAVSYPYRIGRYEVNNQQYVAFLNAVAAEDPNGLYDTNMTHDIHGGILRTGRPGEYQYAVKAGHEHRPAVWVAFANALRFCNWLHHGQPAGAQDAMTTEDGAYTLTPEGIVANTITRNAGARYWIPNDDEWYKAAYHQPADAGGDPSGYWRFPTRSNEPPFSEEPPGWSNSANACCGNSRRSTDVGSYVDAFSFYGTFDQAGNVEEWTETVIFTTNRRLRGGSWSYNEYYSSSTDFEFDTPDYAADGIGFRVAGALDP